MNQEKQNDQVLVAGFAQLPKGTPVFELQKVIGCVLVVDTQTHIIEKATFTFIQAITNEFLATIVEGRSIMDDLEVITKDMEKKLLIPPQKATIQSFVSARNRYLEER
ncbi:hypothetical protein OXB_0109 [Bacillus sp. OxB-1]|uniref:DUF3870 domain-containing protein n=1 Tax=Bacillus sp. (strain OxB-1) TaxID=98228 RepID=UPI000582264A|nr:DUF3870 domain-containing protein [Bacillus sp. OxB-1]BAQ08581.1 hypothetical protein OXB_0109 [Bacillus sp. OxB-1]